MSDSFVRGFYNLTAEGMLSGLKPPRVSLADKQERTESRVRPSLAEQPAASNGENMHEAHNTETPRCRMFRVFIYLPNAKAEASSSACTGSYLFHDSPINP